MADDVRLKRSRVPRMEGAMARWYARQRGSEPQLDGYRRMAVQLTEGLPDGAAILEVAPGPGYHAVELARLGRYRVSTLDVSRTFVDMVRARVRDAGVDVDVRLGDVHDMPFADGSFDLVVCQAAFKNFTGPVRALDEMCRVLRPGGTAVVQDMSHEATSADIAREVRGMRLSRLNAFMTRSVLAVLRLRAFSAQRFTGLAAASRFGTCEVYHDGIGLEVRLRRP